MVHRRGFMPEVSSWRKISCRSVSMFISMVYGLTLNVSRSVSCKDTIYSQNSRKTFKNFTDFPKNFTARGKNGQFFTGNFQKLYAGWNSLPSGFFLPYLCISSSEMSGNGAGHP